MKRFSAVLFVLLPLSLFAQNYVPTITFANMDSASNKVADLQSCFGTDRAPLFDELYILGRTWQEKIYQDYYKSTNISVAAFDALPAEEKELPDEAQYAHDNNGSWVIGETKKYLRRVKEVIERRKAKGTMFGICWGGGHEDWYIYHIERNEIEEVNDTNLPENKIGAAEKDTYEPQSTCNGQYTSQIRRCTYYSWVDASGNDVSSPVVYETKIDTLGVLVQKINTIQFNPYPNRGGELRPYNSAIERISATETVTVEGALGAGDERQGEWYVDEVKDEVFYTAVKDTVYTVLSYTPRTFQYSHASKPEYQLSYTYFSQKASNSKKTNVWSYDAAIWEANNIPASSEIIQFRTPCYVYKKNGNGYTFARVFDATKENIGKITTSGKKIYLTGRCISFKAKNPGTTSYSTVTTQASVGVDGPGFITIDCSGTTDLYIENLELQTKKPESDEEEPSSGLSINARTHLSVPIVLQKDGNKTCIHIKGRNLLMGNSGNILNISGNRAALHGAAVYINASNGFLSNDKIECTFDDKWPISATEVDSTNGFLKLVGEQDQYFSAVGRAQRQASPIYMGNNESKVTFDGGEYRFVPADASENTTTNNMIAATREYSVEKYGFSVTAYGIGHCIGQGTVHFKSGTFSMTASVGNLTPIPPVSDGTNLMRVPAKSIIDGGTFNGCVVRRCGDYTSNNITCPQNSSGKDLFEFKITGDLNSEGYLDNLDLPTDEGFDYDYYNFTNCLPLQDENGDYYYSPYLPSNKRACGVVSVIQNWDVGFPSGLNTMITHEDRRLYMNTKDGNYLGTKRLAFIELNPYYPEVKSYTNSHITESKDYEIKENVYLMTWSMSDKWRIITLPFDVSDVYVLETWATKDNGVTKDRDKEFQYYTLAAQQIVIKGNLADLSKNVGSNNDFLGIYNSAVATTEDQVSEENWRVAKKPYKMTYWREDGTDTPANYYLYEAKGNNAKAIGLGSQFERVWEAVPRHKKDGNSIIMEKGKTYAIMFPNWVSSGEPGWNYWDGKYILFEGPGQTLSGTNSFTNVTAPTNDNEFQFGGNPTFGFVTPSHPNVYTWDYVQQEFVRGKTKQMSWLDSYIVANDATTRQLAKIGRRGNPSYDTSTDNRLQGATPLALEVYSMEGGLRFYAYVDQELTLIDMMGRVVASLNLSSNSSQDIQLPTGVYVVRSSQMDQMMKVMVK